MERSLRFLAPDEHDRVAELIATTSRPLSKKHATQISVIKVLRNSVRYIELLRTIERSVAKDAGYNFILKNVPREGSLRETNETVKIDRDHMIDTLAQFGTVTALNFNRGTVYACMNDPIHCHKSVNSMLMGSETLFSICI
jgi:hypothetical protein